MPEGPLSRRWPGSKLALALDHVCVFEDGAPRGTQAVVVLKTARLSPNAMPTT